MKQITLRDTEEFWRGREFERVCARRYLEMGCFVMCCYDLEQDKAPMLEGPFQGHVLPDLQVSCRGMTEFRECKLKADATETRMLGNVREHGIALHCWRDYCAIQQLSGLKVGLVIGEESSGEILVQYLDVLGKPRTYDGPKMGRSGMAFWPRSLFRVVDKFDSGQLESHSRSEMQEWRTRQ